VYQSLRNIVTSPSGNPNGTGITALLFMIIPPYPPEALWKFSEGK